MKKYPVLEETEIEVAPKKLMGGGIRIPIPNGFKIPQGKREGDEIEFLVKGRQMGGHLMLDELNGIKLSDKAEEEEEEMEPEETADETADQEGKSMEEEDGDEQFASELSNAIRQMR